MKKKFLLVDDDNVAHFINRRLLETSEFAEHIAVANNGEEAIQYILDVYENTQSIPDIILLDVNMPVMNGFKFIETLRTLTHIPQDKIKIILLSSSDHERDRDTARQLGIKYYLNKPLSAAIIQNVFIAEHII